MLKAIQVPTPVEQQAATAEMATCTTANVPTGAAAMEYEVQAAGGSVIEAGMTEKLQQSHPEKEKTAEMEEFNQFRDYLGLINLVKSFAIVPEETASPTSEYSFEQDMRERRDSLGSAGSEFSSSNSAESIEVADIYYTVYGHDLGLSGVKQGFMENGEDSLKGNAVISGGAINHTALMLEHRILNAKKPQVS